jgi:hypothetical protein
MLALVLAPKKQICSQGGEAATSCQSPVSVVSGEKRCGRIAAFCFNRSLAARNCPGGTNES